MTVAMSPSQRINYDRGVAAAVKIIASNGTIGVAMPKSQPYENRDFDRGVRETYAAFRERARLGIPMFATEKR